MVNSCGITPPRRAWSGWDRRQNLRQAPQEDLREIARAETELAKIEKEANTSRRVCPAAGAVQLSLPDGASTIIPETGSTQTM